MFLLFNRILNSLYCFFSLAYSIFSERERVAYIGLTEDLVELYLKQLILSATHPQNTHKAYNNIHYAY